MGKLYKKVLVLVLALAMASFLSGVAPDGISAATNYYHRWNDGKPGTYTYGNSNATNGNFSLTWSTSTGNVMEGKGWKPCDPTYMKIGYNVGLYTINGSNGSSCLGVRGWVRSPELIEFFIIDSWQNWRPSYTYKGTIVVDGATYDVYTNVVVNAPSILGTSSFTQWWSVRQSKCATGTNHTISVKDHIAAWKKLGFPANASNWEFCVFGVEGYKSSGSCNATVWDN